MAGLSAVAAQFDIGNYGLGGSDAEAVALAGGGYVVTWSNTVNPLVPIDGVTDSSGSAIMARFLNADGSPAGTAFQVNSTEAGFQSAPEITQLSGGNVVIAWTSLGLDGNGQETFARIYDASGSAISAEVLLHSDSTDDQALPQIHATPDGGFLATWTDERTQDTYDSDIRGRYFNADGSTASDEFIAWGPGDHDVIRHEALVLDDGGVRLLDGASLILSDGDLMPGTTPVLNARSGSGYNTHFETNFQTAFTTMTEGRYAAAGMVQTGSNPTAYEVRLRVYDSTNYDNQVGIELDVSDAGFPVAAQNLVGVDATGLADGGIVVTWAFYTEDGDFDVLAQLFDADLNRVGDNVVVHEDVADNQSAPFVSQGADGNVLIGWTDDRGSSFAITGRLFNADTGAPADPTEGNDTLTGTPGDDVLNGLGGDDSIAGLDGSDTLIGGTGNDTIIGGETGADLRDVIYGGDGDDSIDGGYGNDELRGDAGNDTISGGFGVDTVIGGTGADVLTGQAWSDLIFGGDGDDFINGGFGYDRVNGGAGADRFYHLGVADHGSDWVQDYTAADGDVLVFGQAGATADQFQVNLTETANAGVAGVEEAFVIYRPTGQIMWALVDGGAQDSINLVLDGVSHGLLA